mgnify:CR=1 FL=1
METQISKKDLVLISKLLPLRKELDLLLTIQSILKKIPDLERKLEEIIKMEGPKGEIGEKGERGDRGETGKDSQDGRDGKDGKNGKDGRDGLDGRNGKDGKDGRDGKDGSPDTSEQIRDKLETLEGNERLDKSAIKGLDEEFKKIGEPKYRFFGGTRSPRYEKFSFSGNGSTTQFTLPDEPAGKGLAIWCYYQGQWLQPTVHFTIAGKKLTTTFTADNGTIIEGFIQRIM